MRETITEKLQVRVYLPQVSKVHEKKGGNITKPDCILRLCSVEMWSYKSCLKNNRVDKPIYKSKNMLQN